MKRPVIYLLALALFLLCIFNRKLLTTNISYELLPTEKREALILEKEILRDFDKMNSAASPTTHLSGLSRDYLNPTENPAYLMTR